MHLHIFKPVHFLITLVGTGSRFKMGGFPTNLEPNPHIQTRVCWGTGFPPFGSIYGYCTNSYALITLVDTLKALYKPRMHYLQFVLFWCSFVLVNPWCGWVFRLLLTPLTFGNPGITSPPFHRKDWMFGTRKHIFIAGFSSSFNEACHFCFDGICRGWSFVFFFVFVGVLKWCVCLCVVFQCSYWFAFLPW